MAGKLKTHASLYGKNITYIYIWVLVFITNAENKMQTNRHLPQRVWANLLSIWRQGIERDSEIICASSREGWAGEGLFFYRRNMLCFV